MTFGVMMSDNDKFGETMICFTKVNALRHLSKHNFMNYTVLNEQTGSSIFHFRKNSCHYKYPLIISAIALDRSKQDMYKMFELVMSTFPGSTLCTGDTDSLYFCISDPTNKYISKLKKISHHLDLSTTKRASGVPRHALRKLTHEYFKSCLFEDSDTQIETTSVSSSNHQVTIVKRNQNGFSSFNPRRHLLPDRISSLAHGHKDLREEPQIEQSVVPDLTAYFSDIEEFLATIKPDDSFNYDDPVFE